MLAPFLLTVLVPLLFSHFFAPFGLVLGSGSFERFKVLLAFFLVLFGILEVLFRKNKPFFDWIEKYGFSLFFFLFSPFISISIFSLFHIQYFGDVSDFWNHFLFGSYEKYHGYIFLFLLLGSFLIFSFVSEHKKLIQVSLITASIVSFFAILESIGIFSFLQIQDVPSWGIGRSISTLGNPNYLAGYLLIHFPLISVFRKPEKYIIFFLLFLGIITTKSLIGISLLGVYFLYLGCGYFPLRKYIFPVSLVFIGFFCYSFLPSEKWLSLTSRWILIYETIGVIGTHPMIFFFGAGPDSLIQYFSLPRTSLIDAYFPESSPIDSSHNIFLDILFQYGIFFLGFLLYLLYKNFQKLQKSTQISLLFFLGFFSLNPYILSPFLVILGLVALDLKHTIK